MTLKNISALSQDCGPFAPSEESAMFWTPSYLVPSPALQYIPLFFWLLETFRPGIVVNFSGADGLAHLACCEAVQKLRLDSRCYYHMTQPNTGDFLDICANEYARESQKILPESDFREGISFLAIYLENEKSATEIDLNGWLSNLENDGFAIVYGSGARRFPIIAESLDGLVALPVGVLGESLFLLCNSDAASGILDVFTNKNWNSAREWFFRAIRREAAFLQKLAIPRLGVDSPNLFPSDPGLPEDNLSLIKNHGDDLDAMLNAMQKLESDLEEQKKQMGLLKHSLDMAKKERREFARENERLRERVQAFENSTIWRLTRPIRIFVMLFRR